MIVLQLRSGTQRGRQAERSVAQTKTPRRRTPGAFVVTFESVYSRRKRVVKVTRAPVAAPSTVRGESLARRAADWAAWAKPAPEGSSDTTLQSVMLPFG